jgi:hypothetical protein
VANSLSRAHLASAAIRIPTRVICDGLIPRWAARIFLRVSSLRTMPVIVLLILMRVSFVMIILHYTIIDRVIALFK